jgi:2-polyprenyl-3-methyl-5-hydroxy-6-metoxy-1,4-benzoquinol methylase
MSKTQAVQHQYSHCPYPPLEAGELPGILPPASSWEFAHYYCSHQSTNNRAPLILDAGCGTGFSTLKLARANPQAQIIAVDLSAPSLSLAKERFKQANCSLEQIQFIQADLQALTLNHQFDYIYCTGVLHHLPQPRLALESLRNHLKPQGLAAIMLYNPHARQEIRAIQHILHSLWHDKKDLQEGLMLCRIFFKGLPEAHPFSQLYQKHQAVITQELGEKFAHSDAFLVDTYLQICEQEWDLRTWWNLFAETGWQILRFNDEESWLPAPYLPGLPDYYQQLSWRERCCLIDPLRRDNNYLFFVGQNSQNWQQPTLIFTEDTIPQRSPLIQVSLLADGYLCLENRLGKKLELAPIARQLWEQIEGQDNWKTLIERCIQPSENSPNQLIQALKNCAQQLLQGYFVWNSLN